MLSPRFAQVMLAQYRKVNGMVADSSFRGAAHKLETKYGWGHEAWVEEMAVAIEKMKFAETWTPDEVKRYIANFVRSCEHSSPASVPHVRNS